MARKEVEENKNLPKVVHMNKLQAIASTIRNTNTTKDES